MTTVTVEQLVPFFRDQHNLTRHFHLTTCICGCPTWQQPCPFCGYYPRGRDTHERDRCRGKGSKEQFVRRVNAAGGIHGFWLNHRVDSSIASYKAEAKYHCDNIRKNLEGVTLPTAEEIWDHFTRPDIRYDGKPDPPLRSGTGQAGGRRRMDQLGQRVSARSQPPTCISGEEG